MHRQVATTPSRLWGSPVDKIKILIIDEHQAVRQALLARLSTTPGFQVEAVGSFSDGVSRVASAPQDIVLMEVKGKDRAGLQAIGQLAAKAQVIVLTSYEDEQERRAALKAGARRYWLKDIDSRRLIEEIQAVVAEAAQPPAPPGRP